ncbi:hypothetical protein PMIN04_000750 [Paraphaeosphaeria minitans]
MPVDPTQRASRLVYSWYYIASMHEPNVPFQKAIVDGLNAILVFPTGPWMTWIDQVSAAQTAVRQEALEAGVPAFPRVAVATIKHAADPLLLFTAKVGFRNIGDAWSRQFSLQPSWIIDLATGYISRHARPERGLIDAESRFEQARVVMRRTEMDHGSTNAVAWLVQERFLKRSTRQTPKHAPLAHMKPEGLDFEGMSPRQVENIIAGQADAGIGGTENKPVSAVAGSAE